MKSIFSRVIISTLVILMIGIGILTLGLNFMYKNYIVDRHKADLIHLAEVMAYRINYRTTEYLETNSLREEMINLETYADLKVWIMINNTHVLTSDLNIDGDLVLEELKENEINEILNTQTPIFRESNFKIYDENEYYTLIYPIQIDESHSIILFLNKSLPNINEKVSEVNSFSFFSIAIVFLYSAITLYFSTKKMTDEIGILNTGVRAMAKGNFDTKLNLEREDEIGELSRNLTYMAKSLNELEQTRRKFVSNVSHDLRSPMTSISGYVNGILDGTIPEDRWSHYLEIVSDESNRMIKLINEVLDLSKIQDKNYTIRESKVDINALILSVIDSFERRLHEKNINVDLDFSKECFVLCDEMLIIRVVNNLVDNAVKFVDNNGVISVKTEIKNDKLIVGIKNTGGYIEPEKIKTIWGRFTKLDDSRSAEKSSSGLGLSIVKEIIKAHNEKIDVYSDKEDGTIFLFSLRAIIKKENKKPADMLDRLKNKTLN